MKKLLTLIIPLACLLSSCSKEKGTGVITGEEREVEMNLLAPGLAPVRSVSDQESAINDLALLVFDSDGPQGNFLYSRYAWRSSGNTFKTTLRVGQNLTIYFAANAASLISSLPEGTLDEGKTWTEIYNALKLDQADISLAGGLPMWGKLTGRTISDSPNNHLGSVSLLRSVASVDLFIPASDFNLETGYVSFVADKGYLAYDPANTTPNNGGVRVTRPANPAGFLTTRELLHHVSPGQTDIAGVFYLNENSSPLDGSHSSNKPTKVIVKGTYTGEGAGGMSTYYPLSIRNFNSGSGDYEKMQVTRNNKYTIIVTNVNGDGYGSLEEAKDAEDVNADYEIIDWNGNLDGDIHIDGPKYLFKEKSVALLGRDTGSTAEIIFKTNYALTDIKMKFPDDADFSVGSIDTHDRFNVRIVMTVDNTGKPYNCFRVTAKQDYGTMDNPATLTVTVGRIQFTLDLRQLDSNPDDWNEGGNWGVDL